MISEKYDLGTDYTKLIDFTHGQQQEIKQLKYEYRDDPIQNWKRHIAAFQKWKDPVFVNYEYHNHDNFDWQSGFFNDLKTNPLYVFQTLLKPGKQYFAIQHSNLQESPLTTGRTENQTNQY